MATVESLPSTLPVDIENSDTRQRIVSSLDGWAKQMATDIECRMNMETNLSAGLWDPLETLWKEATKRCLDNLHPSEDDLKLLSSIARFTRNLVAGVNKNQTQAYERTEPYIQKLIHYFTSFLQVQREEVLPVTRLLTQTLSNIVTNNEKIASLLWTDYMSIPHDGNILLRLLSLKDAKTIMTCFILMLNAITGSVSRCTLFVDSKAGQRIAIKMLLHLSGFMDATEGSVEATACDIGYQFLKQTFESGLAVSLYSNIANTEEPVMPYQQTLLKLLDGYLQTPNVAFHANYSESIPRLYSSLLAKVHQSVESSSTIPDQNLPPLAEDLTLAAQCVQILLLRESESGSIENRQALRHMELEMIDDMGSIELTAVTLRGLDILVPRIQFGKVVPSPLARSDQTEGLDPTTFPYVKRDLVRLLGTLAYKNKVVQDRMRLCGGIEVILNQCVVDERNPYLREHAIFTLRNLLEDNEDNQEVVRGIRPLRDFDSDGVLRNIGPQE